MLYGVQCRRQCSPSSLLLCRYAKLWSVNIDGHACILPTLCEKSDTQDVTEFIYVLGSFLGLMTASSFFLKREIAEEFMIYFMEALF